ncbi:excisionase [Allostella vacuolata]|nr:excisionase [Stella vacuolata]
MIADVRPSSNKAPADPAKTIPARERTAAARIALLLSSAPTAERNPVAVIDAQGERVELPAALAAIIHRAAELVAEGRPVAIMPDDAVLSTQEAADLLNLSRQYLVRLVDAGEIPARKVGRHRRLRLADVLAFKTQRDARRMSALDRLSRLSEEAGGYALEDRSTRRAL